MTAIYADSFEMTMYLLNKGADVNIKNSKGWTALDLAKQKEDRKIIQALHRAGNFQNADLIYAARIGDTKWLNEMIKDGADVNGKNEDQEAPLLWASFNGQVRVAKILLDNGARINDTSKEGWSALMAAVENGSEELVKLLLARGADVNLKIEAGSTALTLAQENENTIIVDLLQRAGESEEKWN
jgi:ankyrin repeat protein